MIYFVVFVVKMQITSLCGVNILASPSTVESSSSLSTSTQEKPRDSWALDSMLQSSFFSGIPTGSASASPNLFANFSNNKPKTPGKLSDLIETTSVCDLHNQKAEFIIRKKRNWCVV